MKIIVISSLVFSFITCFSLGTMAFIRAKAKSRFYSFSFLCMSASVFAIFYAAELLQPDLRRVLFCISFEYLGMVSLAVSMFFVIRDFDCSGRASISLLLLVSIIPALTVAVASTAGYNELLYVDPSLSFVSGLTVLKFGRGPWYWVNAVYIYSIFGYGISTFLKAARNGPMARRRQSSFMLAGSLSPLVANLIYLFGLTPVGVDATPIAFSVATAFYSVGFFRYRLFDIHPLARDMVFGQMRDAAIVVDENGAVIDHNKAASDLFPTLASQVGGVEIEAILASRSGIEVPAFDAEGNAKISIPNGEEGAQLFEAHRSGLQDKAGRPLGNIYTLVDVTEREHFLEELETLASIDELTRIPNRRRFYELAEIELERARRHGRPIGFAVMDMDGFKPINDRYGHHAGDEALRIASSLSVDTIRSCDVVGRIGGDEFAFIFPECDEAGAATAAKKIQRVIGAATFASGYGFIVLSASIGYVGSTGPIHMDLEQFLATADQRMYVDKLRTKRS